PPREHRAVYERLALVPEDEAVPGMLTPRQLCEYVAALHRVDDPGRVDWALSTVEMLPVAERRLAGFSKGMRQRAKVAAALVKNPLVLVLDEPLNGADPVQRRHLIDLFRRLGDEGRTIIVSSHVLHEVEAMSDRWTTPSRASSGSWCDDRPRHDDRGEGPDAAALLGAPRLLRARRRAGTAMDRHRPAHHRSPPLRSHRPVARRARAVRARGR